MSAVKAHVKKGDTVTVITGSEEIRGKSGKVIRVLPKKGQVFVEGLRMIKKHRKASQSNPQGGIVSVEGPIHISNVRADEGTASKPAARKGK
jgi:large subunit ribosomal protein L24